MSNPDVKLMSEEDIPTSGTNNLSRIIDENYLNKMPNEFKIDNNLYTLGMQWDIENGRPTFIRENNELCYNLNKYSLLELLGDHSENCLLYKFLDRYIGHLNPYRLNKESKPTLKQLLHNYYNYLYSNPMTKLNIKHELDNIYAMSERGFIQKFKNNNVEYDEYDRHIPCPSKESFYYSNDYLSGVIVNDIAFYSTISPSSDDESSFFIKLLDYITLPALACLYENVYENKSSKLYGTHNTPEYQLLLNNKRYLNGLFSEYNISNRTLILNDILCTYKITLFNTPFMPKVCEFNENNLKSLDFLSIADTNILEFNTYPTIELSDDIPLSEFYSNKLNSSSLYYYNNFSYYNQKPFRIKNVKIKKLKDTEFFRKYIM